LLTINCLYNIKIISYKLYVVKKNQYVDLLNALRFLGMPSFETELNMYDDFTDMKKMLAYELTKLK
jgi:hypothetical protein